MRLCFKYIESPGNLHDCSVLRVQKGLLKLKRLNKKVLGETNGTGEAPSPWLNPLPGLGRGT